MFSRLVYRRAEVGTFQRLREKSKYAHVSTHSVQSHSDGVPSLMPVLVASGGWGVGPDQRPHSIPELREYTKSLYNSEHIPRWIFRLYDFLEEHEEEFKPWFLDLSTGKMAFVEYHRAQKGGLPDNWVAVGDAMMKLNPVYGEPRRV